MLSIVERESKAVEKAWEQNVLLMEKKSEKIAEIINLLQTLSNEEAGLRTKVHKLNDYKPFTLIAKIEMIRSSLIYMSSLTCYQTNQ